MMFDGNYEVYYCDTEEARKASYRLRYEVYCRETGYEDPQNFPDKHEYDQYDNHSLHFLARCKETGDWVGALRLVLGDSPDKLPFSQICDIEKPLKTYPGITTAEISRVCVLRQFRRKTSQDSKQSKENSDGKVVYLSDRKSEPEILLGLLRAAYTYSRQLGIESWFALYTKSLARIFSKVGFNIEEIGPEVEHRGKRSPYKCDLREFLFEIHSKSPHVANLFSRKHLAFRNASVLEHGVMDDDLESTINCNVAALTIK